MSPDIVADVECNILLNYKTDLDELNSVLPEAFYPIEVDEGVGIGGVSAASMKDTRPKHVPRTLGITTDNTMHWISVKWKQGDEVHRGRYVVRRDAQGRVNAFAERAFFPGDVKHGRVRIDVDTGDGSYWVRADCDSEFVRFDAEETDGIQDGSVFGSTQDVLKFFANEEVGYAGTPGNFEVVNSTSVDGEIRPLEVRKARSSFFEKLGSDFDSAFSVVEAEQQVGGKTPLKVA